MPSIARRFPDMWVDPQDDPRDTDGQPFGERAVLLEYLHHYRLTFEMKCADLDAEQLARRSVPPSTMSLLGLVRHLANVEHQWFVRVMQGRADEPRLYRAPDGVTPVAFEEATADPDVVAEAWTSWRSQVAAAEAYVDGVDDLARRGTMVDGTELELREVLVHMIEEYARHCGHADLLRERIDGRTGQ